MNIDHAKGLTVVIAINYERMTWGVIDDDAYFGDVNDVAR